MKRTEEKMKRRTSRRLLATLLALCMVLSLLLVTATAEEESGTCGDNLTWTLDTDGTLTISGTGDMDNYDYSSNPDGSITYTAPWYEQRNNINAVVIENGVTSIGSCAFPECNGLTDMTIPGSVTTIGDYAFWSCVNLTSVTFSQSLTGIGEWVFASCTDLTSVILDDSVSSIGEGAFNNCGALTDVYYAGSESQWEQIDIDNSNGYNNSLLNATIHYNYESTSGTCGDNLTWTLDADGILTISGTGDMYEYYAMLGIDAPWHEYRESITAVVIKDGATRIGNSAFFGCTSLTSVDIPDSVTSIGEEAFGVCSSLTSITIPDGVTYISYLVFRDCSSLTSVNIPDGVTEISESAFNGCNSLSSVTIPNSVTSIGYAAFTSCTSLTDVYYDGSKSQWEQIKIASNNYLLLNANIHYADDEVASGKCGDNLTWKLYDDGTLIISGTGDMYDYEMFYGEAPWSELRDEITAVVIENGATSIGKAAFWNCTGLTSVDIPNSVATIGNYAFTSCGSLAGVTIPDSVTYIGEAAFQNCTSLPRVTIPDSVTSVGMYAFSGCERLTSVTISKSITEINQSVFSESGLTSVTIPGNVTAIYSWAFGACSNLTSVTILDGVTEIGPQAFYECSSLASVTIPYSLTGVNYSAFDGCESLDDVYYGGTRSQWEEIDIDNTENGNDPLLNANIHFADEETHEPITLPNAVKYVPYSFALGLSALEDEGYSLSSYEVSGLPDWLEIDPETYKVYGVPMTSETYEFSAVYVYVLDGETITADVSYSLTVLDNSNSNVKLPNDYEILENIGTKDPDDPDNYLLTEYRDEKFIIDAPYEEFYRLLIDGVERTRDTDYTAEEGSVVLTIKAETFQEVGEGTHTVAADFRGNDASGRPTANTVSQNYTLTVNQPNNPGGGNTGGGNTGGGGTGGGGTGGGGGAGSAPASYGINVPDIPNCTVTLSATSASAGTVVTLTVQPYEGYELTTLTVTGPNGERLTLTQVGENQFTFQMPGGNVDISAQVQEKQPGNPSRGTPFVDVLETDWFYESVLTAYERGWLAGTSANTFSPYATSLRCMFVTVLHRIAGEPSPADNSYFSDVPSDQYYAPAAAWALEQGIVTGYGDGRFGSNDSITREQIVIILHNYANLIGMDTAARNDLSQFTDLDQLSAEAQQAMSWANAVGLISGKGDGILDPVGSATRAEMAALLVRFATLADM